LLAAWVASHAETSSSIEQFEHSQRPARQLERISSVPQEVAVCFGGRLMRGNRCQKTHSSFYQAFDTLTYPYLANLGVDVDWNMEALLHVQGVYRPRSRCAVP
jgi:hypothetical protein